MRKIYQQRTDNRPTNPFLSSEEAWFWCCLCADLGYERAKGGSSNIARPCESSDILIAVRRLQDSGVLRPAHIKIMEKYGKEQAPPHHNFGATERICALWREAMNRLGDLLQQKGIVSCAT